jgi:type IV secretory pathway ATPase VirB11/archaellum biosynthesis ATPase
VSLRARTPSHIDSLRLCGFGAVESERDDGFSRRVGGRERESFGRPSWRIRHGNRRSEDQTEPIARHSLQQAGLEPVQRPACESRRIDRATGGEHRSAHLAAELERPGTLDDYVAAGIMRAGQAATLRMAVADRRNILVAGGTSTGKTTLTNALLAEVAKTADRVVLIEDTRELQCKAPNLVALRTKDGVASLSDLVRSSLRLRPDRIPIGEVRGAEALDLLKAWGTGHPGGIGTIHAGSALGALRRMEQLIQEAVVTVPRALIAETIQFIAVLAGRGSDRRLAELACVEGLGSDGDYVLHTAGE